MRRWAARWKNDRLPKPVSSSIFASRLKDETSSFSARFSRRTAQPTEHTATSSATAPPTSFKVLIREKFAHTVAILEATIRATAPKEIHKARLWVERVSCDAIRNPRMITTMPTAAVSTLKASSRMCCKESVLAMGSHVSNQDLALPHFLELRRAEVHVGVKSPA